MEYNYEAIRIELLDRLSDLMYSALESIPQVERDYERAQVLEGDALLQLAVSYGIDITKTYNEDLSGRLR